MDIITFLPVFFSWFFLEIWNWLWLFTSKKRIYFVVIVDIKWLKSIPIFL